MRELSVKPDAFTLELQDPLTHEWEPAFDLEAFVATWGRNRPPRLTYHGIQVHGRFRIHEIVSAGTDRWLLLDAISGVVVVDERPMAT